mmetsp:Transcript_6026/g.14037  ORF Transcript_6026/g.14037 Transcript_6026/m.14037 type:complete len:84 (-) Transcript_6026:15-266(-)|eukprot:scaffold99356_cov62-Phaeocystis_antarctica.AAC.1
MPTPAQPLLPLLPLPPHPAPPHSPPPQHAALSPVALSPPSESLSLIAAKLASLSLQSEVGATPPPHPPGRAQLRSWPVRRGGA